MVLLYWYSQHNYLLFKEISKIIMLKLNSEYEYLTIYVFYKKEQFDHNQ